MSRQPGVSDPVSPMAFCGLHPAPRHPGMHSRNFARWTHREPGTSTPASGPAGRTRTVPEVACCIWARHVLMTEYRRAYSPRRVKVAHDADLGDVLGQLDVDPARHVHQGFVLSPQAGGPVGRVEVGIAEVEQPRRPEFVLQPAQPVGRARGGARPSDLFARRCSGLPKQCSSVVVHQKPMCQVSQPIERVGTGPGSGTFESAIQRPRLSCRDGPAVRCRVPQTLGIAEVFEVVATEQRPGDVELAVQQINAGYSHPWSVPSPLPAVPLDLALLALDVIRETRTRAGVTCRWAGRDMGSFALWAVQDEQFGGMRAGVGDAVRDVGVEFGGLAGGEDQIVLTQGEQRPAGQDVEPLVPLVRSLLESCTRRLAGRNDLLVGAQATEVAVVSGTRPPVPDEGTRMDARVAGDRGAPTNSSSGTLKTLDSGSRSSRVGLRSPDSRRDRVLSEIPVVSLSWDSVVPCCRRSARSRAPTPVSTLVTSSSAIRHLAVPATSFVKSSGAAERYDRAALAILSPRENEVVVAGRTNAEIAAELFMTVATVKAHVSHILGKLGLDNRTQIALLAHDAGLA